MPWKERSGNSTLRDRYVWIWRCAVALVAIGTVAAFAFAHLFTTFMPWDDEGYFLLSYRDFLSGQILYDHVFAIYGPLTFFTAALFARFDVANVSHDAFRWILLPVWVAIAALMGGLVLRWTRSFIPSVATVLLVGFHLRGLAKGVGHPQVWILLAVAVLLWLTTDSGSQAVKERRAFGAGVVIGAILLFKVNVGILVFIGVALAGSLHLKAWPNNLVFVLLTLAACALGIALFVSSPTTSEKFFPLVYLASLAATIGITMEQPREGQSSLTSLKWLVAGLAVCVCIVLGVTLAGGTTLGALYNSYVTMPALLARNYHGAFSDATRKGSILISTLGLCAAVGVFYWRRQLEERPAWLGILKATAGAGILCAFCYDQRMALSGSLLFLWLLIVDVRALSGPAYSNRVVLALLSPLFSLQIFPMAGEQVDWAALLPMTAAAVLLADGMNCMGRESCRLALPNLTGFVAGAIAILLASYIFSFVAADAIRRLRLWHSSESVNLQGAHWLRLSAKETARLNLTVSSLKQNCETVLMVPGLYSFSIWSGVSPFEEKQFNSWPFLWPEEVKEKELRTLPQQRRGCVLVSQNAYRFFKHFGGSQHSDERLLSEIQQKMRPIYTVQDMTLYVFLR